MALIRAVLVLMLTLARLRRLLRQENCLDVGKYTALGDGYTSQKFVELLVVADCELKMSRNDARLLVISCSIARQLKDLSCQVLEDCSQVDGRPSSNPLSIVALS